MWPESETALTRISNMLASSGSPVKKSISEVKGFSKNLFKKACEHDEEGCEHDEEGRDAGADGILCVLKGDIKLIDNKIKAIEDAPRESGGQGSGGSSSGTTADKIKKWKKLRDQVQTVRDYLKEGIRICREIRHAQIVDLQVEYVFEDRDGNKGDAILDNDGEQDKKTKECRIPLLVVSPDSNSAQDK